MDLQIRRREITCFQCEQKQPESVRSKLSELTLLVLQEIFTYIASRRCTSAWDTPALALTCYGTAKITCTWQCLNNTKVGLALTEGHFPVYSFMKPESLYIPLQENRGGFCIRMCTLCVKIFRMIFVTEVTFLAKLLLMWAHVSFNKGLRRFAYLNHCIALLFQESSAALPAITTAMATTILHPHRRSWKVPCRRS